MSTHKSYIPYDFPGRFLWCDNLRQKLSSVKAKFNITDNDWVRLDSGTTALGQANEFVDRVTAYAHAWTQYRKQLWQDPESRQITAPFDHTFTQLPPVDSDFEDFLRRLVKHIESEPAYTEADGKAFGFVGPEISVDTATAKPVIRAELSGGRVRISYDKHRTFSGVRAWVDRGTGAFEPLGTFTRVSFDDPAALPDTATRWVYRLQYLVGDTPAGLMSDPHEVLVSSTMA